MDSLINSLSVLLGMNVYAIYAIFIWTLVWKGLALWKAAKLGNKVWFIILLVISDLGIISILYLYVFSNLRFNSEKSIKKSKAKKK